MVYGIDKLTKPIQIVTRSPMRHGFHGSNGEVLSSLKGAREFLLHESRLFQHNCEYCSANVVMGNAEK
jgi:hypothetical protein